MLGFAGFAIQRVRGTVEEVSSSELARTKTLAGSCLGGSWPHSRLDPLRRRAASLGASVTASGRAAQSAVALLFTFGRNGTDRRNVATEGSEAPQGYVAGVSLVRAHTAWGACNPCPRLPCRVLELFSRLEGASARRTDRQSRFRSSSRCVKHRHAPRASGSSGVMSCGSGQIDQRAR